MCLPSSHHTEMLQKDSVVPMNLCVNRDETILQGKTESLVSITSDPPEIYI